MKADDLRGLAAPFPADRVSWRVGSTTKSEPIRGMALAYVDARDIMDRLDEVVGPANWQDKYRREHETTICSLSIRVDGKWVTKEDGSGDTDVEAEKGALSKALVRAAVKWQIGRYLYDLDSPWVECDQRGKSVTIKSTEMGKLRTILDRQARSLSVARQPEQPKAVETATPFDGEDDTAAVEYAASVFRRIEAATDPRALAEWWRSDDEKQARRDFGLTPEDVATMKDALMKRLTALAPQMEAAA